MKKEQAEKLLKKVKDDYAFGSEAFSKRTKPWESIFELIKSQVGKNKKVLDVGCGDGRYFASFEGKNIEYVGIDNCGELIEKAKRNLEIKKLRNCRFKVGDVLNLKFNNDEFDVVLCIAVLHHIPSRELQLKALEEMHRVLKPGGKLIMTNWHLSREIYKIKHITQLLDYSVTNRLGFKDLLIPWGITGNKINRYYYAFSLAELKGLVKRAGFKIDEAYYIDRKSSSARWRSFWKRGNIAVIAQKW